MGISGATMINCCIRREDVDCCLGRNCACCCCREGKTITKQYDHLRFVAKENAKPLTQGDESARGADHGQDGGQASLSDANEIVPMGNMCTAACEISLKIKANDIISVENTCTSQTKDEVDKEQVPKKPLEEIQDPDSSHNLTKEFQHPNISEDRAIEFEDPASFDDWQMDFEDTTSSKNGNVLVHVPESPLFSRKNETVLTGASLPIKVQHKAEKSKFCTGLWPISDGHEIDGRGLFSIEGEATKVWPIFDGREIDGRGLFSVEEEATKVAAGSYQGTGDSAPPRASIFDTQVLCWKDQLLQKVHRREARQYPWLHCGYESSLAAAAARIAERAIL